jgi:hypothetical protein
MKNIENVESLLNVELSLLQNNLFDLPDNMRSLHETRIIIYKSCLQILETNPRPEYLYSEITRIQKRLLKIDSDYKHFNPVNRNLSEAQKRSKYNKMYNVTNLKLQLRVMIFLYVDDNALS